MLLVGTSQPKKRKEAFFFQRMVSHDATELSNHELGDCAVPYAIFVLICYALMIFENMMKVYI